MRFNDLKFFFDDEYISIDSDEVYNFGYWAGEVLVTAMKPRSYDREYKKFIPKSNYLSDLSANLYQSALINWLKSGEGYLIINKEKVSLQTLQLNTLLHLGNNVFIFMARIFGQADYYTYIEGANRNWLANILTEGINKLILSRNHNWSELVTKLKSDSTKPVVVSYKNDFPSQKIIQDYQPKQGLNYKNNLLDWNKIGHLKQTEECITILRKELSENELKPENWLSFKYQPGFNGFDLLQFAEKNRIT